MDIGKHFLAAWEVYTKNFVILVVAMAIVFVLSLVTIGIMVPVLLPAYQMMFLRLKHGEAVTTNDLFLYVNKFGRLFITFIIIGGLTFVGTIFLVVPGVMIATLFMYSLLLIAEDDLSIMEALKKSSDIVIARGFWIHILFFLVAVLIGSMGSVFYWIGTIFTQPLALGAMANAYAEDSRHHNTP